MCTQKEFFDQSSSLKAGSPEEVFFADILRRNRQKICVTRDVHSSFTTAVIIENEIENETASNLREALLTTTSSLRAPSCVGRIDSASGFQSLRNDASLQSYGINLDFDFVKNKNSNSVFDKAIQELELEFLKVTPSGGIISSTQLQLALQTLNSRIRNRGLSAREILFQRDQVTNEQLRLE